MSRQPERRRDHGGRFTHLLDLGLIGAVVAALAYAAVVLWILAACASLIVGAAR